MNDIGLKTRNDALIGLITGVRRCTPRIIAAHDPRIVPYRRLPGVSGPEDHYTDLVTDAASLGQGCPTAEVTSRGEHQRADRPGPSGSGRGVSDNGSVRARDGYPEGATTMCWQRTRRQGRSSSPTIAAGRCYGGPDLSDHVP